jgi:hypothetical protein
VPSARFRLRGCVKESVALDDRLGYVDKPAAVPLGVPSKLLEGLVGGNAVAFHEDAFGLFDGRASAERSLEVVKLGEAEESNFECALELLRVQSWSTHTDRRTWD